MQDYTQSPLPKKSNPQKSGFRKRAIENLRSISLPRRRKFDHMINNMLFNAIKKMGAKTVMLYVPLDLEADVMPLIGALRRRGVVVYVPFMEGESFRLVQYRLPLKTKKYGVKEPKFSKKYRKKVIDLAIIPIVGTDRSGRRVGFGKGMYDRFFASEGDHIKYLIFVQRALQQSKTVVTDVWDIAADEIITAI